MQQWQLSAITSGCLFAVAAVALLLRRSRAARFVGAFSREAGLIIGLFTLWQLVRILAITKVEGGIHHAEWVWHVEQWFHLPSEVTFQRWFLPHRSVIRFFDTYYAYVHFPAMSVFLIWLFLLHRRDYPQVRNTIVGLTGACLLIQMIPVAPPRMLPELGFVDTALANGQSVYGAYGSGIAAQLSAMPSVHVGWAVLIAYEVIRIGRSRWRWLIVLHPVLTITVVTVTANHWWADGIVAVALLVLADLAARGITALGVRRRVEPPVAGVDSRLRQREPLTDAHVG